MQHNALAVCRGALLFRNGKYWLLWDANRVRPLCMPIRGQAVPRSRWDHRLRHGEAPGIGMKAAMICARHAREIDTNGMIVLGQVAPATLAALAVTIRRAAESETTEARFALT